MSPNSNKTKLNLYVNFILDSLPESTDSVFEVCDCENFIVVKGMTSHSDVINLNELNHKFEEKYCNTKLKNTIDLIRYDYKMGINETYEFIFQNESMFKPDYENNYSFFETSDFPYGRSWSKGKLLYFYFKFITSKIPSNYPFKSIKYKVNVDEEKNVDFEINDDYLNNDKDILKSAILDIFSFNLDELESDAKKMDLEKLILNPNKNELFSKTQTKDFVIL